MLVFLSAKEWLDFNKNHYGLKFSATWALQQAQTAVKFPSLTSQGVYKAGMVHAWVGQKLLKSNKSKSF